MRGLRKAGFINGQVGSRIKNGSFYSALELEKQSRENVPVHVFSSADEAELFLNGESLGRKQKGEFEYRFRWDNIVYQP